MRNKIIKAKIPKHCKGCPLLHTVGIKDGKHNAWCCAFGKPASKSHSICKTQGRKPCP